MQINAEQACVLKKRVRDPERLLSHTDGQTFTLCDSGSEGGLDEEVEFGDFKNYGLGDPNFIWGAAKLGPPKPTLVTTWTTCQALC